MRIERLISMIMILLKQEIVSTQEFAERFGVSKRTILRDVETLSLANIPIYTQRGSRYSKFIDCSSWSSAVD